LSEPSPEYIEPIKLNIEPEIEKPEIESEPQIEQESEPQIEQEQEIEEEQEQEIEEEQEQEIEEEPEIEQEPEIEVSQEIDLSQEQEQEQKQEEDKDYTRRLVYPHLGSLDFQANIAERKEFREIPFDNKIYDVSEKSNELCNKKNFETLPHQLFVHHFLSQETPYNSLLLYHGLGTGKTCSSIGVAEEMRYYMKQLNIQKKIMIVAFPNVQDNFKRQLFDESRMVFSKKTKTWNLESCVGNQLLKEIDP
jgi:signal recognition particle GTPase